MTAIPEEQMAALFEGASERRGLEFKEGFTWVARASGMSHIQCTVVKSLIAMCNTPKGGILVIGVTDNGASQHDFVGVDEAAKASFQDTEKIASLLDSFATSPMDYEVGIGTLDSKEYIVFTVSEFRTQPVQCAKEHIHGSTVMLRRHALYARSSKAKPETIDASPAELREIITMAEERDEQFMRKFVPAQPQTALPTDTERYDALDEDLI